MRTVGVMKTPIYGLTEAAQYLRVPLATLRYWVQGGGPVPPLIRLAGSEPSRLSFMNLLECYMLSSMPAIYDVRIPKVRKSLANLATSSLEGLFDKGMAVFIEHVGRVVNLSKGEQILVELYLERIERGPKGVFKLYPFVMERTANEPRLILINPAVGFGKPVIAGTGISTAVVSSRFNARESVPDLASEYGVTPKQIEEAIRWEQRTAAVSA